MRQGTSFYIKAVCTRHFSLSKLRSSGTALISNIGNNSVLHTALPSISSLWKIPENPVYKYIKRKVSHFAPKMSIPLSKWLVMVLLAILSTFLGFVPLIFTRFSSKLRLPADSPYYKLLLTILSCFGAGVLFSTCLLHLLPEVRESFASLPSVWTHLDDHFPLAECMVICGFCLIYLIEEIAHFIMVDGHHDHQHRINTVARHNSVAHALPIPNVRGRQGSISLQPPIASQVTVTVTNEESTESIDTSLSIMENQCPDDKEDFTASLRTFLALIALSFHAIMEGVAIGLQNSSNVWLMFGAVASHKFVISFCMGMELVTSQAKLLTYVASIVFFAVVSPIGIIIGSVLASDDRAESVPVTVIEGLACGTILYVVFFEILNRERERKSYGGMGNGRAVGFIQFVSLIVGLVGMGCLLVFTHEEHDHGDEDGHDHGDDHDHSHEHLLEW